MNLDTLYREIRQRGITLRAAGGKLRAIGTLTPSLRDGIREHRAVLLEHIQTVRVVMAKDPTWGTTPSTVAYDWRAQIAPHESRESEVSP